MSERERMQKHRNEGTQDETGLLFVILKEPDSPIIVPGSSKIHNSFSQKSLLHDCSTAPLQMECYDDEKRHIRRQRRKRFRFVNAMHFCRFKIAFILRLRKTIKVLRRRMMLLCCCINKRIFFNIFSVLCFSFSA